MYNISYFNINRHLVIYSIYFNHINLQTAVIFTICTDLLRVNLRSYFYIIARFLMSIVGESVKMILPSNE